MCHCAVVTRVVGDCFAQAFAWLEKYIRAVHDDVVSVVSKSVEPSALKKLRHGGTADATGPSELLVCGLVRVVSKPPDRVVLSWKSSPAADLIADSLVAIVSHADVSAASLRLRASCCGAGGGAHSAAEHEGCTAGEAGTSTDAPLEDRRARAHALVDEITAAFGKS